MTKRILAIILCFSLLCPALFGCAKKDENDNGAYITMYLTDDIYDFDPANAYYNSDAINVLGMMYDTLFKLDEKGKVKKSLVEDYKIVEDTEANEYYIEFTLREAFWSVNDQLTAEDVVFAWKRLVDFRNSYEAASLLFDIKNARAVKEGDASIDDLGVEAVEDRVVRVSFECPIDYDQFFLNLTSVATAPLLKRYVSVNDDWAKKPSTIATSGPFKLGKISYVESGEKVYDDNAIDKDGNATVEKYNKTKKIEYFYLERNSYYFRDTERDAIDSSVTPYRLLVDCTMTPEKLLTEYQEGQLFYIGSIPMALRTEANKAWLDKNAEIKDALSTFVCYLNEDALIDDGATGSYLFANKNVRKALSLALDRDAIAKAVMFAEAATALVPTGVFDIGTSGEFRTSKLASNLIVGSANLAEAQTLLADIKPSDYSFSIKAAAYDDVHLAIAELIKNAWVALGFNVTVEPTYAVENNDYFDQIEDVAKDVCDDLFIESIQRRNFEVIALDLTAYSADAYSVLSNFAYAFSGTLYSDPMNDIYEYDTHKTGYHSVRYNIMMEAIHYLPYYAGLQTTTSANLKTVFNNQPYVDAAKSAVRKLNDAILAAEATITAVNATMGTTPEQLDVNTIKELAATVSEIAAATSIASKQAVKNITYAEPDATSTKASQDASNAAAAKAATAIAAAADAVTKAEAAKKDATADAIAAITATLTALTDTVASMKDAKTAMEAAAATVSQKSLYEAIGEVYTQNGITPSTKTADHAKQRSTLLHKAEELLLDDMPVIPVIYNQDAVLINKGISKISATYYIPAYFRKTKMKNYKDFTFVDPDTKKTESIFKDFPNIYESYWDKAQ